MSWKFKEISNQEAKKWIMLKSSYSVMVLIILMAIFLMPIYLPAITHLVGKSNEEKISAFSLDLTRDANSSYDKLKILYDWEVHNYKSIYGLKPFILPFVFLSKWDMKFCIRTEDPLWTFTSRCGACGEAALLYCSLVKPINISCAVVKTRGEDHTWTEIYIDNNTIIIDPSMKWFNASFENYTSKKNHSYVYAEYFNGTKVDRTWDYTIDRGKLIIDSDTPLKKIEIFSLSLGKRFPTDINCNMENLPCELELGSTSYEILTETNSLIPKHKRIKINLTSEGEKIYINESRFDLSIFSMLERSLMIQVTFLFILPLFMWLAIGLLYIIYNFELSDR